MRVSVTILALATALVSAQTQNYTSSLDMTLPDPNLVDPSLRSDWCRAQSNTCENLCSNSVATNDCDYNDLSYECLCASNNSAPALEDYTQTLPTFICQTLFSQCIELNAGSQDDQEECKDNIEVHCATTNPPDPEDIEEGDGDDEDDDDEPTTTATTATQAPTETSANEDSVSTTDSDGLAAPTAAPRAVGALAAIGLIAAFI